MPSTNLRRCVLDAVGIPDDPSYRLSCRPTVRPPGVLLTASYRRRVQQKARRVIQQLPARTCGLSDDVLGDQSRPHHRANLPVDGLQSNRRDVVGREAVPHAIRRDDDRGTASRQPPRYDVRLGRHIRSTVDVTYATRHGKPSRPASQRAFGATPRGLGARDLCTRLPHARTFHSHRSGMISLRHSTVTAGGGAPAERSDATAASGGGVSHETPNGPGPGAALVAATCLAYETTSTPSPATTAPRALRMPQRTGRGGLPAALRLLVLLPGIAAHLRDGARKARRLVSPQGLRRRTDPRRGVPSSHRLLECLLLSRGRKSRLPHRLACLLPPCLLPFSSS